MPSKYPPWLHNFGDPGADPRIILKLILKKEDEMRIGLIWARIGTSVWLL
jgi:hypothetical protein